MPFDRVLRLWRYLRHFSTDFRYDYGNPEAFDPFFPNLLSILCLYAPYVFKITPRGRYSKITKMPILETKNTRGLFLVLCSSWAWMVF